MDNFILLYLTYSQYYELWESYMYVSTSKKLKIFNTIKTALLRHTIDNSILKIIFLILNSSLYTTLITRISRRTTEIHINRSINQSDNKDALRKIMLKYFCSFKYDTEVIDRLDSRFIVNIIWETTQAFYIIVNHQILWH